MDRDPFELFQLKACPKLDPVLLEQRFLESSARVHPDGVVGDEAKMEAERASRAVNEAYQLLISDARRLSWLLERRGWSSQKVAGVTGPWADLLMEIGGWGSRCDRWLVERREAGSALEKAMTRAEGEKLLEELGGLRERLAELSDLNEAELVAFDQAWMAGEAEREAGAALLQKLAFRERAEGQIEERFLKLAEELL
jgi:curved DNA-binding protein CbpA